MSGFLNMIGFSDPDFASITQGYSMEMDEKIYLIENIVSKPMLVMMKGTGNDPTQLLPLDTESRKYIHV